MGNKKSTHKNYLSEKDLLYLEENTNFSRAKIIEWHEAFLIDCPKGKLNKKLFIKLYTDLTPHETKIEEHANYVFKAFDSDKSGYIDFNEFLLSFSIRSRGSVRERLQFTFNVFDTNKDGNINKKEFNKMIKVLHSLMNLERNDKRVEEIMKRIDLTNNQIISKEDFIQIVENDETLVRLLLNHEL